MSRERMTLDLARAALLLVAALAGPGLSRGQEADSGPKASVRADAGDDVLGQVGRQLTLNGSRSRGRGKLGYRWLQMAGPTVSLKIEDGPVYSFVPSAPGVYQFALVVASGSEISEPDLVTASVAPPGSLAFPTQAEPAAPKLDLKELAAATLGTVDGGLMLGDALSGAFDGVAGRVELYRTYEELLSELSRRLEAIVPADPARRSAWLRDLFSPLTARVVERLRAEGLDLGSASGRAAELTAAQRAALGEAFRAIGEGFRDAGQSRRPGPRKAPPIEK